MRYDQFQTDLLKISSEYLIMPEWVGYVILVTAILTLLYSVVQYMFGSWNSNRSVIIAGVSLFSLILYAGYVDKYTESEMKIIYSFVNDPTNFKWEIKETEAIIPFTSIEEVDQPIYLKISKDTEGKEVFGFNQSINGETEYREEKCKKREKPINLYSTYTHEQLLERKIYWNTDTNKVSKYPSKILYEYKLKENKFYKNKDKLPLEFWREIKNNSKEKVVFYIPKQTVINQN